MNDKIKAFGDLHVPGNPLILYNIWDAGSAKAVADAGAKAIATGSWGVACAHGYKDGETFPVELVLANLTQILQVTELPVTLDFESGYGAGPAEVEASVARAADAGAVGINLEDKDPVTRQLFSTADATARIKAAASSGLWINARADLFIVTPKEQHDEVLVDAVVRLLPGVLGNEDSALSDSFQDNLLAPPVYTRPAEWRGLPVPEILLSGNTPKIDVWRHEQALERTQQRRPDLLE